MFNINPPEHNILGHSRLHTDKYPGDFEDFPVMKYYNLGGKSPDMGPYEVFFT